MMRHWLVSLVMVAACTKAGTGQESPPGEPTPGVSPTGPTAPTKTVPSPKAKVELTAVTLADDCGGSPPWSAPTKQAAKKDSEMSDEDIAKKSKAKRRCEQTSMQLSITATDASSIKVKSVELFDDKGASLGTLAASKPTRWSDASASYEAWDEAFVAGSTSNVSYVLEQPKWDSIADRWNKTYTLKAVVSIGGADQSTTKDVTVSAPTTLPPNVKT